MAHRQAPRRAEREGQSWWRWPLPKDVREALAIEAIENPALLFQRYVPYPSGSDTNWSWELEEAGRKKNYKNQAWKTVQARLTAIYQGLQQNPRSPIKALLERQNQLQTELGRQGWRFVWFDARVVWRLVVGLGLPNPLETGFTLHHLYGIPYLPGTALKGVTQAWRLQKVAEELGVPRLLATDIADWPGGKNRTPWKLLEELLMSPVPKENDSDQRKDTLHTKLRERKEALFSALKQDWLKKRGYLPQGDPPVLQMDDSELETNYVAPFSRAFGSQEAQGEIVFFDAFPTDLVVDGQGILELDVMTPHYRPYYTQKEPPGDWYSPVPVPFLVVRRRVRFRVLLGQRPVQGSGEPDELLKQVGDWAKRALQELGLGAKTRAGYGELEGVQPCPEPS